MLGNTAFFDVNNSDKTQNLEDLLLNSAPRLKGRLVDTDIAKNKSSKYIPIIFLVTLFLFSNVISKLAEAIDEKISYRIHIYSKKDNSEDVLRCFGDDEKCTVHIDEDLKSDIHH